MLNSILEYPISGYLILRRLGLETNYFKLKIKDNLPVIPLRVVSHKHKIVIDYSLGSYHHMMEMVANGDYSEVVLRNQKVIENNTSFNLPNYKYEKKIDPVEGKVINAYQSNFVVGAGNGFFGMGITKAERLKDCYFTIIVTAKKVIKFDLTVEHSECILLFKQNANAKELDISQSPRALLYEGIIR